MADLDVAKLRNELQELSQQRHQVRERLQYAALMHGHGLAPTGEASGAADPQVNERLRSWDAGMGRGRGRGPGPGMGSGRGWGPGPDRGMASRLGEPNGGPKRDAHAGGFRDRDAAPGPSLRGAGGYRNDPGHGEPDFPQRQPPGQVQLVVPADHVRQEQLKRLLLHSLAMDGIPYLCHTYRCSRQSRCPLVRRRSSCLRWSSMGKRACCGNRCCPIS